MFCGLGMTVPTSCRGQKEGIEKTTEQMAELGWLLLGSRPSRESLLTHTTTNSPQGTACCPQRLL